MSWAQCKRYNQLGGAAHSNDTVADGRADQACDLQDGLELSKLIKSLYSLCMIHTAPEVHMVIGRQVYHNMLASFGMQIQWEERSQSCGMHCKDQQIGLLQFELITAWKRVTSEV
jgi:hypothetical protein